MRRKGGSLPSISSPAENARLRDSISSPDAPLRPIESVPQTRAREQQIQILAHIQTTGELPELAMPARWRADKVSPTPGVQFELVPRLPPTTTSFDARLSVSSLMGHVEQRLNLADAQERAEAARFLPSRPAPMPVTRSTSQPQLHQAARVATAPRPALNRPSTAPGVARSSSESTETLLPRQRQSSKPKVLRKERPGRTRRGSEPDRYELKTPEPDRVVNMWQEEEQEVLQAPVAPARPASQSDLRDLAWLARNSSTAPRPRTADSARESRPPSVEPQSPARQPITYRYMPPSVAARSRQDSLSSQHRSPAPSARVLPAPIKAPVAVVPPAHSPSQSLVASIAGSTPIRQSFDLPLMPPSPAMPQKTVRGRRSPKSPSALSVPSWADSSPLASPSPIDEQPLGLGVTLERTRSDRSAIDPRLTPVPAPNSDVYHLIAPRSPPSPGAGHRRDRHQQELMPDVPSSPSLYSTVTSMAALQTQPALLRTPSTASNTPSFEGASARDKAMRVLQRARTRRRDNISFPDASSSDESSELHSPQALRLQPVRIVDDSRRASPSASASWIELEPTDAHGKPDPTWAVYTSSRR